MYSRLTLFFSFYCVLSLSGFAATLNVPADSPTIQAAIDSAVDGDIIIVESGIYYENIIIPDMNITVKSAAGPYKTTLDGSSNGSVVNFEGIDGPVSDNGTVLNRHITHLIKKDSAPAFRVFCAGMNVGMIVVNQRVDYFRGFSLVDPKELDAPSYAGDIVADDIVADDSGRIISCNSTACPFRDIVGDDIVFNGGGCLIAPDAAAATPLDAPQLIAGNHIGSDDGR